MLFLCEDKHTHTQTSTHSLRHTDTMLFVGCSQHLSLTGCRQGERNECNTVTTMSSGEWKERNTDEKSLCALWHWPTGVFLCLFLSAEPSPSSSTSAPCVAGQSQGCKARSNGVTPLSVCLPLSQLSIITPLLLLLHFRCFSSLSPVLPASPCRLLGGLLRNILSSPLRASVR